MDRRTFLTASSLIAVGGIAPNLLARAAEKAKAGADRVLVVVEMTGGNDGLNTVIPFADDLYYKARPTLAVRKRDVVRIDDSVGLHPQLYGMHRLLQQRALAVVLGVGYPGPNRSHFDSMDIWQSGDVKGVAKTGWLGRGLPSLKEPRSGIRAMHVAPSRVPLALQGPAAVVNLSEPSSFALQLSGRPSRAARRRKLLESLNAGDGKSGGGLAAFVRQRQLQTLRATDALETVLSAGRDPAERERLRRVLRPGDFDGDASIGGQLQLIARLVRSDVGARIYYASMDGFDTHGNQGEAHGNLLSTLSSACSALFEQLQPTGDDKRVVLMTYSEFGRRVQENGSRGTDHGAGSHLFVAGPAVKAGLVGKYPKLNDLTDGDLKFGIDFRRVYATLLDKWLGVDSKEVLGGTFEHLPLLA
jgi:uncharacterized protein (DUF1501 family)